MKSEHRTVKSASSDYHALSLFLMMNDAAKLFLTEPLADLQKLLGTARQHSAEKLLLLAGKKIIYRANGKLSPPLNDKPLHFAQTQALAQALLGPPHDNELEETGSTEFEFPLEGNRNGSSESAAGLPASIRINIFYGEGAHNIIITL